MEVRRVDLARWALRTSHRNSSQGLNISSVRFFYQITDPEIPITLRHHKRNSYFNYLFDILTWQTRKFDVKSYGLRTAIFASDHR